MADTIIAEDAGFVPEPVPDTIADIELNGLNPTDESTDSEPVEDAQDDPSDDQPDTAEEPDTTTEDEAEKEPEQPEQKPADDDVEARRKFNSEQAALRVQQRQERQNYFNQQRAQIREAEQELPEDRLEALERKVEISDAKDYINTMERNQANIVTENMRAQQEIPLFNPSNPEWQQGGAAIYQAALERFNRDFVVTDEDSGQVVGAYDRQGNPVSLLNYLYQESLAMSPVLETTVAQSQQTAQKAEAKMRAKAVNPSNPGKVTSSGDELQDLLDKIGDVPLV